MHPFLQSRHFLFAMVGALLITGAGAATYAWGPIGFGQEFQGGCAGPSPTPAALDVEPEVLDEDGGRTRTITYTLDPGARLPGRVHVCGSVADVYVEPSPDDLAHIEFKIGAPDPAAVDDTRIGARMSDADGRLDLDAWVAQIGRAGGFFSQRNAHVDITLRVPTTGPADLHVDTSVGDQRATGLLLGNVTLSASVGDVRLLDVDALGDIDVSTSVGDQILRFASLQTSTMRLDTSTGDIDVRLPGRADIGYDVEASSSVGDIEIDIGAEEARHRESDGVGADMSARSQGYDDKPTQVRIRVDSSIGDITILIQRT